VLTVEAGGVVSTDNSTEEALTFCVYVCGTNIIQVGTDLRGCTNTHWHLRVTVTVRGEVAATAKVYVSGYLLSGDATNSVVSSTVVQSLGSKLTLPVNSADAVKLAAYWGAAKAGNTVTQQTLQVTLAQALYHVGSEYEVGDP
jgi:hypothetical protein